MRKIFRVRCVFHVLIDVEGEIGQFRLKMFIRLRDCRFYQSCKTSFDKIVNDLVLADQFMTTTKRNFFLSFATQSLFGFPEFKLCNLPNFGFFVVNGNDNDSLREGLDRQIYHSVQLLPQEQRFHVAATM